MANVTESAVLTAPNEPRPKRVSIWGRDSNGDLRPVAVGTDGQLVLNLTGEGLALDVSVDGIETLLTAAQSVTRLVSAAGASGDATNVKNAAGTLYGIKGYNAVASVRYLKLYNSASAPTAGSGTPRVTLALPPAVGFAFDWPQGLAFSTGIGFTLVTGSADNSSVSVTAADIVALNIEYT